MKHLRLALAAAMLATPLAGQAQVLDIATDQSPVGLDPHVATSFATQLVTSTIYEGLTAIDAALQTVPALAQSWTVSPDGKSYHFVLRQGATFHNGRAVTAADVAASIARVRDPKTGSPYASRFTNVATVAPDGDGALTITLTDPSAPFLAQLAAVAIVPPEAVATLARQPVGTGPFVFRQWVPDTFIGLDRNAHYWDAGLPKLAGLKFDIVPEAATRQLGLAGGSYGMLPALDAASAAALATAPGVQVQRTEDLAYSVLGLNAGRPPFDKPEVREAVNTAIDRAQLVQAAYYGQAVPAGPLSPALTGVGTAGGPVPLLPHRPGAVRGAAEAGRAHPAREDHDQRAGQPAAGGGRGPGAASAAGPGRLRSGAERAGAGALHRRLARRQLPGLRQPEQRRPGSGRLLRPLLHHGGRHQRLQVQRPDAGRHPGAGPHQHRSGDAQDAV